MLFEPDDLQMSDWEFLTFAATGYIFTLGVFVYLRLRVRIHLWMQGRKRSPD